MSRMFGTAADFKRSLEARLKHRAIAGGRALERERQLVVFERYLARLFDGGGADIVVKGGLAGRHRGGGWRRNVAAHPSARSETLDVSTWSHQSRTMTSAARPSKSRFKAPATASEAPRRVRADKLSVSLGLEDVQWVTRRAKQLGTSASAVIASALSDQRRAEARDDLLASLGDEDITQADVLAARREAFGQ